MYAEFARILSAFFLLMVLIQINSISAVNFRRNSNITNQNKIQNKSRVIYLNRTLTYETIINAKKKIIAVFCIEWNIICKELSKSLGEASKYALTQHFEFLYISCGMNNENEICKSLGISKYPLIKTLIDKIEVNYEPGPTLENILEFIVKISEENPLQILNNREEIEDFTSNFGEVTFLLETNSSCEKSDYFYKCVKFLAEDKYKPSLYFGFYNRTNEHENAKPQKSQNESMTKLKVLGRSLLENGYNIEINLLQTHSCDTLVKYVESNKYPILKELDSNYLNIVRYQKLTIVMAIVSKTNQLHKNFVFDTLKKQAFDTRKLGKPAVAFTYIYIEDDNIWLKYLKLTKEMVKKPKVVVFNFERLTYYIGDVNYDDKARQLKSLENLLKAIENKTLKMQTGNLVDDWFEKLGVEISPDMINTIFFLIVFSVPTALLIIAAAYLLTPESKPNRKVEFDRNIREKLMKENKSQEEEQNENEKRQA